MVSAIPTILSALCVSTAFASSVANAGLSTQALKDVAVAYRHILVPLAIALPVLFLLFWNPQRVSKAVR